MRHTVLWFSQSHSCLVLHPSVLRYTLFAHKFVTDALLHCCTSFFLPFSLPVLSGASAHPPLFMFYASCMPSATSSKLLFFSSFMGSFAPSLSHIPFMSYFHCVDFNHSTFYFLRHLCVPIFSLSVHLICHLLHILPFSFSLFFQSICTAFSLRIPCDASSYAHQLPFNFSPLGHSSIPKFLHSMHFMWLPTICTTIKKQLQPTNLSIFPSCMFLCCSFQLSVSIPTFNFLSSVLFH